MVVGVFRRALLCTARLNAKFNSSPNCYFPKKVPQCSLNLSWFSTKISEMEKHGVVPDVVDTVPPHVVEVCVYYYFVPCCKILAGFSSL